MNNDQAMSLIKAIDTNPDEFIYECENDRLAKNLYIGRIIRVIDKSAGIDAEYEVTAYHPINRFETTAALKMVKVS